MMPTKNYCPNCGAPVGGARFCGNCGTNLFTGPHEYTYPPAAPPAPLFPSEQGKKTGETYGIISIICGVIGFIIFTFTFGPIAIVLGFFAREKGAKNMGNIGMVLGVIDIILGIVTLVMLLVLRLSSLLWLLI